MDPAERTHELIERLANLLRAEARLADGGALQPVHLQALAYLARCNRYSDTPGALTEYLGLTKGTVSQTLNVLEREGLLERRGDPADRRRVRLRLTAAGRRVVREAAPPPLLRQAVAALGPEREGRLAADLEELLRALQRAHGGRPFGVCRTCRHFQGGAAGGGRCGLTDEPLSARDAKLLCREACVVSGGAPPARPSH